MVYNILFIYRKRPVAQYLYTSPTANTVTKAMICIGSKIADRTTMAPLIKQNVNGIVMCGRKGRFKLGSRKRRIRSPKTVRKKKENSTIPNFIMCSVFLMAGQILNRLQQTRRLKPLPIKVTRAWKLPITIKIMLIAEGAITFPLSDKGKLGSQARGSKAQSYLQVGTGFLMIFSRRIGHKERSFYLAIALGIPLRVSRASKPPSD